MTRQPSRPGPPPRRTHAPAPRLKHPSTLPRNRVLEKPPRPLKRPKSARPRLTIPRRTKTRAPKRQIGHFIDEESTLLDVLDNLLSKGVVLNADLILALANVDLVYIRLSALLCAADRVLPHARR